MTKLVGVVAFGFIIYFTVKMFKFRKLKLDDRASKALKKRYRSGLLLSILIMIITLGFGGGGNTEQTTSKQTGSADTTKVVKKQKYIGKDKYQIAKKENVALLAKQKKLQDQADSIQSQKDQIASDEAAAKQKEQDQKAAAQKQQEEQAKEAQKQQEQAAATQKQQQASSQTQTRGDMNTSSAGSIVGNTNSHIYHVPGQAGYNMNSSNAVYFNSEQEAIAAGYRRSKR
ncbi:DNA-entry nuclease [Companilactobacillus huachuanensis]|uniref:DNA-entry nuclease n=1 Tax=Companilactobacillus huachuanensis TaxID=2559914 RepID=A0ABW1RL40_9LACO|nr:DNA-entry nuclease [Companilactobacillus huachuanensis]